MQSAEEVLFGWGESSGSESDEEEDEDEDFHKNVLGCKISLGRMIILG